MYTLKWKTRNGWQEASYASEVSAQTEYDILSSVYIYVTLTKTETTTTTEVLRDSSAG